MKQITISDVARQANVSKATVSAVINGRSTVNEKTRGHVLKIIKELNYRPKGHARILKKRAVEKSIGLIIRELDNPFYTSIAMGIKKYANSKEYVLFIASSESDHENEENISQLFASKDVKGVIIAPVINGTIEIDHLFRLKTLNYPFVMLEEVPGIQANVVSIDNVKATTQAVKYLVECGYTDIIHFTGPEFASHTYERINGFRSAFSETPLIFTEDLLVKCGSHFQDGYDTGMTYFNKYDYKTFPTAVVCYNDVVALGLISALQKLNINVPEQVAIVGNDDIEFAAHWSPALTTISTPLEELGQKAAEILIRNIEEEESLPLININLDAKLIVRETTGEVKD